MKRIEKLDNLYRADETPTAEQLKALGFSPAFGWHYLQSRIDENEVIDFNDFFDSDIEGIARDLKANGSLCVAGNEDVLRANADRFQSLQMEP